MVFLGSEVRPLLRLYRLSLAHISIINWNNKLFCKFLIKWIFTGRETWNNSPLQKRSRTLSFPRTKRWKKSQPWAFSLPGGKGTRDSACAGRKSSGVQFVFRRLHWLDKLECVKKYPILWALIGYPYKLYYDNFINDFTTCALYRWETTSFLPFDDDDYHAILMSKGGCIEMLPFLP